MKPVIVMVERSVQASADVAFGAIIPVDLASCFTGWGPFPTVVGVEHQPGAWDAAGKTRTVLLKGGGIMRERMLEHEPPVRCAYEVLPHVGPLGLLVERINGQFVFRELHRGTTQITWTYEFIPRRGAPIRLLAPLWRRYARQTLDRLAAVAEAAQAARPSSP